MILPARVRALPGFMSFRVVATSFSVNCLENSGCGLSLVALDITTVLFAVLCSVIVGFFCAGAEAPESARSRVVLD